MNMISNHFSLDLVPRNEISNLIKANGGEIYYSSLLLKKHSLPDDSLKVRRCEYKKGRSQNYKHHTSSLHGQTLYWYDANSIPDVVKLKYNLPSPIECSSYFSDNLRHHIQLKEAEKESVTPISIQTKKIEFELISAMDRAQQFKSLFLLHENFGNQAEILTQKYAVLLTLLSYWAKPKHNLIKKIHQVLQTNSFKHLGFPQGIKAFYSYMGRAQSTKDLRLFVLGKWNVRNNARKVNDLIEELIRHFAGHANGVSNKLVRIWVNTIIIAFPNLNGKRKLEQRTIDKYIELNQEQINNYRNGEDYIRKFVAGYLHMESARNPMDVFLMDEWWIDLKCNKSNKSVRKIVLGMMDGMSRKMINHKITHVLNSEIIKEFLHETVVLCRDRMAAELICDFASYNVCKEIERLFDYLVFKYKSKFSWTRSSNANRKAELERAWLTAGSMLSPLVGWTGPAITVGRENAHPAKVMTVFLNDPSFLEDELEADRIIDHIFKNLSKKGVHQNAKSPNELFRDNKHINALELMGEDLAFMFGNCEVRKLRRSQVTIDSVDYQFFDPAVVPFINHDVNSYCYKENEYVFKQDSFEYIGEFTYYTEIPKAKINQSPEDISYLSTMCDLQNNQIKGILQMKQDGLNKLLLATGNVDPGEVINSFIDITFPVKSTSVSQLNPAIKDKIGINPFNLPDRKKLKRAERSKRKIPPVSAKGLLDDNVRKKYS